VEPHGPHLPLGTDTVISEAASARAVERLGERGVVALIAPPIAYGVTRYAEGFAGAISVPAAALTAFVRAVVVGWLEAGLSHVCLVNNHLEPDHDAAIRRAALDGVPMGRASVASPLTRRWARTLSAEFKSGACHAGRYETSILLAAAPATVDAETAAGLPDVSISLSEGIKAGQSTFREMGIERAYTGNPREATAQEGSELLDRLSEMIVAEVTEGLEAAKTGTAPAPPPSNTGATSAQ
jgi:creatinine amidohydrolase